MKLGDLAAQFELECRGDAQTEILGIASIKEAKSTDLAFLFGHRYKSQISASEAAAIVVRPADATGIDRPLLVSDQPRMAWAQIATLFDPSPQSMPFIHRSAEIHDLAQVASGAAIGANAVIKAGAVVEAGAHVGPGAIVGEGSRVAAGAKLHANVVLYHDVQIGERTIIHASAVIGADGFGYEFNHETGDIVKIPQVYGVRIGSDVEIGAATTIDRGALNHTTIADHCKLDNQVQVGHGTRIDHHTVISGCTAIAGSTRIGSYCLIGGAVGIVDNIEIADQVEITAMSLVSQSIDSPGRYSSGTGLMPGKEWKRSIVGFSKLDQILKRIRSLESKLSD